MEENFFRNNNTPNNPVKFENENQNQFEMQILDENLKSSNSNNKNFPFFTNYSISNFPRKNRKDFLDTSRLERLGDPNEPLLKMKMKMIQEHQRQQKYLKIYQKKECHF